jgi:hypothetical protein
VPALTVVEELEVPEESAPPRSSPRPSPLYPGAPNVIVRALLSQCALAQQLDRPSDVLAAPPFQVIMAGACRIECEALAALGRAHEGLAAL